MFGATVAEAIRAHAAQCYPMESCGLVTAAGYEPQPNVADDPYETFVMPPEAEARMLAGDVLAVVHSHPDGPDHPSIADQEQQVALDVPFGLVVTRGRAVGEPFFWGSGIPEVPLLGRDFRWGPTGTDGKGDCWALVRDWYAGHGLFLPEFTRDEDWLSEAPTRYLANRERVGFCPVPTDDLRAGDLVFFAIQSGGIPNHSGIYLGDGLLLHHLQGHLSRRELIVRWLRSSFRPEVFRHPDLRLPSTYRAA